MTYRARLLPRSSRSASSESSHSWVSSGSMSGNCVGRPSWITDGVVGRSLVFATVPLLSIKSVERSLGWQDPSRSSCHVDRPDGIYRRVLLAQDQERFLRLVPGRNPASMTAFTNGRTAAKRASASASVTPVRYALLRRGRVGRVEVWGVRRPRGSPRAPRPIVVPLSLIHIS